MESDTISNAITVSDYSVGCPHCGANNGFFNVGQAHWLVCDVHKTKWCIGSNLFSSWKQESETIWWKNAEKLANYSEVEAASRRRLVGRPGNSAARIEGSARGGDGME